MLDPQIDLKQTCAEKIGLSAFDTVILGIVHSQAAVINLEQTKAVSMAYPFLRLSCIRLAL